MNCRTAQRLLSSERDGALPSGERAALDSHVEQCADCRRFRVTVAGAVEAWRTSTAQVPAPDVERAWHAIRREIRSGESVAETRSAPWFSRWMIPVGAAAALAIVATILLPRGQPGAGSADGTREVARVKSGEVAGGGSSVVYVDDKSGWTVVWAVDEPRPKSG